VPTSSLVLAIDGGGTSTTACLAGRVDALDAKILGQSATDQSNPAVVGFERCRDNVLRAAELALAAADKPTDERLRRIAIGLAGLEATDFQHALRESVAARLSAKHIDVLTDIELLLLASSGDRPTVGVISGTGSVAVGRSLDGTTARAGGRGFLTGDAGSGFWLGQQGFTAAIRALDHVAPETQLVQRIGNVIGSNDPATWTNFVYSSERDPRSVVASFAPIVLAAAQDQDNVASDIVDQAGSELATFVLGVSRQLAVQDGSYDLILAGGVLVHETLVRQALDKHLNAAGLRPAEQLIVEDPAVDVAVRMAS
jgi:N-acetylglucosamine kinase-like BadF-type ATPase